MTPIEALNKLDETVLGNLEWKIALTSALEKQMPRKPISIKCFTGTTTANCSVCNGKVLKVNYCQRCGQAIDWSDTE